MIDPKEFRIGNLIYNRGKIEMVTGILPGKVYTRPMDSISSQMNNPYNPEELFPVEISVEQMIKFGGKNVLGGASEYVEFIVSEYPEGFLVFFNGDSSFWIDEESIKIPHCKYIHQLQNLYFSLSGKELPIKF